jgi:hypothetical protein
MSLFECSFFIPSEVTTRIIAGKKQGIISQETKKTTRKNGFSLSAPIRDQTRLSN